MISARTINRMVHFVCPDAQTANLFDYAGCVPQMPTPSEAPLHVTIVKTDAHHYRFSDLDGGPPGTARVIIDRALDILFRQLLQESAVDSLLAAGSVLVHGRRLLVLSDSLFVRQCLMLQALAAGAHVESAAYVIVRKKDVIAAPSRMHLDARIAPMFPTLSERILASPGLENWHGEMFHAFAPTAEDGNWRISPGTVDALLVIEPNQGGHTSAGPVSADLVFRMMLEHSHLSTAERGSKLARLHLLSRSVPCWKLRWGTQENVIHHLEHMVQASRPLVRGD